MTTTTALAGANHNNTVDQYYFLSKIKNSHGYPCLGLYLGSFLYSYIQ